jgi:voltage-gated potassium channel Kch
MAGIETFAYFALLCGLGSFGLLIFLWLAATVLLWVVAFAITK